MNENLARYLEIEDRVEMQYLYSPFYIPLPTSDQILRPKVSIAPLLANSKALRVILLEDDSFIAIQ